MWRVSLWFSGDVHTTTASWTQTHTINTHLNKRSVRKKVERREIKRCVYICACLVFGHGSDRLLRSVLDVLWCDNTISFMCLCTIQWWFGLVENKIQNHIHVTSETSVWFRLKIHIQFWLKGLNLNLTSDLCSKTYRLKFHLSNSQKMEIIQHHSEEDKAEVQHSPPAQMLHISESFQEQKVKHLWWQMWEQIHTASVWQVKLRKIKWFWWSKSLDVYKKHMHVSITGLIQRWNHVTHIYINVNVNQTV